MCAATRRIGLELTISVKASPLRWKARILSPVVVAAIERRMSSPTATNCLACCRAGLLSVRKKRYKRERKEQERKKVTKPQSLGQFGSGIEPFSVLRKSVDFNYP